jgi:NADH dehydrogenase (ubiquinone) 1 alpha/beta subcomplex 1
MSDDVELRVIALIARRKHLDLASITGASAFTALGIDSLDAAELLFAVEDEFAIVVPDSTAHSMRTVGEVVDGVRRLIEEKSGAA